MSHPIERDCPSCGAPSGQHCFGKRGKVRKAFHKERGTKSRAKSTHEYDGRTDSPIEASLVSYVVEWLQHNELSGVIVSTQVSIEPYRADILIQDSRGQLVVECDGKAFHTTPAQVEYDKRRDRFFTRQGYAVMRFTGREIHGDPRGCAAEIGAWILRK